MAPPRCAKCAMPVFTPPTPLNKSNKIYAPTRYLAFTGMGGKSSINCVLGYKIAKAIATPIIAPDAPTIDIGPINPRKYKSICSPEAAKPQTR